MKLATLILAIFFLFARQQSINNLADTNWVLVKVLKGDETQIVDTTCRITLSFDNKGHYKGYSGWNYFNGTYSINSNEKMTMDNARRTKRAGPPNCSIGETLYAYFLKVKNYSLQADTLFIWTDTQIKIVYQRK